ncbi:MAG: recombinase family protein [Terrimicrobiaceae bacterium]|nr:recombinase family protein [Terrimicrobiaceae bacterium]
MEHNIPPEKKTNVAYSYIRFSSPAQMKGDSLGRQTKASEEYAREHGLYIDGNLHIQDLGISAFHGKNATEGKLAGFLTAIRTGHVPAGATLLVESLDRLSREQVTDALTQFLQIIKAGVIVVTLIDKMVYSLASFNENPGSLMLSIVFMMRAHDESATKSKRIGKAWEKKRLMAQETKAPQNKNRPGWLDLVKNPDGTKSYVVIPERAAVLVRMFELAAGGLGKRSIARILNADGVEYWKGGKWAESTLHFMLKWPAAMGIYQPCRLDPETRRRIPEGPAIEGYFPQVISNDLWQRAQCRTQAPRGPRRPSTRNLFTGLVIDGFNGCKMHYNEKIGTGTNHSYLCTARMRPDGIKSQMLPYGLFEQTVLEHLRDLDWSSLVNKGPDQETARLNTQIADAEVHLGKLDAGIEKFLDDLAELPDLLRKSATARAARMAEEREELQVVLEELRRQRDQVAIARNSMTAGVEEFKTLIESGDPQSRLALQSEIRRRVKEISVRTEKTRQGKRAKIAIFFVNGAATWVTTKVIVRGRASSQAIEFEVPGRGLHPFDDTSGIEREPDGQTADQPCDKKMEA